jgi:hypothetical protein
MSAADEKVDTAPEAVASEEEKKTVEATIEETKVETPIVAPSVSSFPGHSPTL